MGITIYTRQPEALLASIYKAIDAGHIATWEYDKDRDFTHTPPQWKNKAWLRPTVGSGVLLLGLLGQNEVVMKKAIYGVYHGRFIEEVLTHFDSQISSVTATAHAAQEDRFKMA